MFNASNIINIKTPFIPKIEALKGYIFKTSVTNYFAKHFSNNNVDLIHAHFAYPEGYAAYKLSKKYNIPYIITGRGSDILIYPQSNRYLKKTIYKTLSNCNAFLGVSRDIIDKAEKLGLDRSKGYFIPDGIHENFQIENITRNITSNKKIILFAGSLIDVKNVSSLLKAFKKLIELEPNVVLKIAGNGYLMGKLKSTVKNMKLSEVVKFLGSLSSDVLADEMIKSDIFCLPSLSEGWPNVIMEAMACGTPVVASKVGGIPEQIISDDYGYLCNPFSEDDIAEKILIGLRKDWNYKIIEKHGKQYLRSNTAEQIVDIYDEVLGM